MAKLKPISFSATALTGEKIEFAAEATVTNAGIFSIELPDFLEELGRKMSSPATDVTIERPRVRLRVSSKVLQNCEAFVGKLLQEYVKCEVSKELVILYNYNTDTHYVKDQVSGEIYPSGTAAEGWGTTASWAKTRNKMMPHNSTPFYSVGINARVIEKITYTRASTVTVKYAGGSEFSSGHVGEWAGKLNSFVKLSRPYNDKNELKGDFMEMPYTEEAAKFFYNMMMSMCKLSDRINSFVGDKEKLMLAIKTPELLMLSDS